MPSDKVTIVLADDAADVRFLVATRLRLSGRFDVVGEAGNGAQAVDMVMSHRPDVVLLDVSMPEMDGLDALQLIVAQVPRSKVVMFTGFTERRLAERALALGAAALLDKSTAIDHLAEILLDICGQVGAELTAIGESREADPLLAEHLERFESVFDQAAIGMASLTLTGRVVRANSQLELFAAGMGAGPLIGTPFAQLVSDPGRAPFLAALQVVASGGRDADSADHRMGERMVASTIAVVRDARAAPLYLFLQVQDITERHAATELLRQSEERFRLLVESVGDYAIFMLDPEGYVASWNLGAERAKGYRAEEIIGRHFGVFYEPEAVASGHPQRELEIAVAEGRYEEEGWRLRKDGSRFWANVVITTLRDATGEHVGFAKVTRDMSERKALLEHLRAAAEERTELLIVTAHELRSPVSLISGFADTLRSHWDELGEDVRREMAERLAHSGGRLSRLVEDLLTAARLESGAVGIVLTPFRLDELVAQTVADQAGALPVDAAELTVLADRGRVEQMLGNYLSNAIRYGRPPITVSATSAEDFALVVVTDCGEGVNERLAEHLFDKFAPGRAPEGTGLGLFIVRELARAQGGDAWYAPAPGGGASFSFRLPLAADVSGT